MSSDGFTVTLINGLAQWLHDRGIGRFSSTSAPPAGVGPEIHAAGMPDDPDQVISLTAYPVADAVSVNDSTVGVQVICRGTTDRRTCLNLDDAVFEQLHGVTGLVLAGIAVPQITRRSGVSLGRDLAGRWEQVSNYYLDVNRPTSTRTD